MESSNYLIDSLKKKKRQRKVCEVHCSPFESGYGHTIGNAFRRVLLSSIEGAAISSLKMDGVQHEFQSVDGVVEDITDIVLNLKKVLIISHKAEPSNSHS